MISRRGAPELTLRVPPRASLTVNGEPARLGDLAEGAEVRVAYSSGQCDRPTALSIEARSARSTSDRPADLPGTGASDGG